MHASYLTWLQANFESFHGFALRAEECEESVNPHSGDSFLTLSINAATANRTEGSLGLGISREADKHLGISGLD